MFGNNFGVDIKNKSYIYRLMEENMSKNISITQSNNKKCDINDW